MVVFPGSFFIRQISGLAVSDGHAYESWFLGVLICILATAGTSLGLVLQKLSHTWNEHSPKSVVYYRQPLWLVGFAIFMGAQVVNLIPMSMTPQVMLSCLGATTLIFNAILACMILREAVHMFEIAVMFGISCGVVMVIYTTSDVQDSAPHTTLPDIVGPLFATHFLLVAACLFVMLLGLRFTVAESSLVSRWPDLDPVTWTLCSAVAGGYTVNLFKAVAEFSAIWSQVHPHRHWECYFIVTMACFLGAFQVHSLNRALNLGRAMLVVPTYCALGLLAQLVVSELVVTMVPNTTAGSVVFASGITVILVFIVLLARAKIAYEEEPEAAFVEVIQRTLSVSSLTSWDLPIGSEKGSPGSDKGSPLGVDMDLREDSPLVAHRYRAMSSMASGAFKESFEGRGRTYSVAVIGLGIG